MWRVGLVVVVACASEPPSNDDYVETPDLAVSCDKEYCQNGTIYVVESREIPAHIKCYSTKAPVAIGTCPFGCEVSGMHPAGTQNFCRPTIFTCDETSACTLGDTRACIGQRRCGDFEETGSCVCEESGWSCEPACSDGLCSVEEVQAALVGSWSGMANQFYDVTLVIDGDGRWTATGLAFPHGGPGGSPGSKFFVQAQTALGAYGIARHVGTSTIDAPFSNLRVEPTRLRFTVVEPSCGDPFELDLQRVN